MGWGAHLHALGSAGCACDQGSASPGVRLKGGHENQHQSGQLPWKLKLSLRHLRAGRAINGHHGGRGRSTSLKQQLRESQLRPASASSSFWVCAAERGRTGTGSCHDHQ